MLLLVRRRGRRRVFEIVEVEFVQFAGGVVEVAFGVARFIVVVVFTILVSPRAEGTGLESIFLSMYIFE